MRGKHDTMGSMAAGAVTGAIFKSTGSPWSLSTGIFSHFLYASSSNQTGHCCCDSNIRHGRNLELCEKERLMFLILCIYNLNFSLILALVSWQICEVTEEDVRNLTFRFLPRYLAEDELIWHSFADILPEF
jgi:hypothetical protein